MSQLLNLPGCGFDPLLELVLTPTLYLKLKRAATSKGLSIQDFLSESAEREADRMQVLDELAHRRSSQTDVPAEPPAPRPLSKRESEVLSLLSQGCRSSEIASVLHIKHCTVNDHVKAIYRKLGVNSRVGAMAVASKMGLGPGQ